jgi:hypothetical protein
MVRARRRALSGAGRKRDSHHSLPDSSVRSLPVQAESPSPEDTPMKPRSTVTALLAMTASLLAARSARAARTKSTALGRVPVSKVVGFLTGSRSLLLLRTKQAIS